MSRPCVFLDRDGVINEAPPAGAYISSWSEFRIIPEIVDWVKIFNALGFLVIVVTNQRGVALGHMSLDQLNSLHALMQKEFARRGARIDDVFACTHHNDECSCRKPKTGLALIAQQKWDIDLKHSIMIGDSARDSGFADNLSIPFVRVENGRVLAITRTLVFSFQS